MDFDARKLRVLEALASDERDKSRAGGVDAPIADLIARINLHPFFFTTSSCSGRISIFSENSGIPKVDGTTGGSTESGDEVAEATQIGGFNIDSKKRKKKLKGGDWVYVSHKTALEQEVIERVYAYVGTMREGLLVFRYEPFILALECRTPAHAQLLVTCALASGFRESGITGMGKRNIVGVRCSIRLEVPIAEAGDVLVPESYLRFLTALANQKMKLNRQRSDQFTTNFIAQVEHSSLSYPLDVDFNMICEEPTSKHFSPHISKEGVCVGEHSTNVFSCFEHNMPRFNSQDSNVAIRSLAEKESKKNLSSLKGRQLRVLARISTLEEQLIKGNAVCEGGPRSHVALSEKRGPLDGTCASVKIDGDGCKGANCTICLSKNGILDKKSRVDGSTLESEDCLMWPDPRPSPATNGRGISDGCSLPAAHLMVHSEPIERLHLWSHSAVTIKSSSGQASILIYGGFGGQGRHARQEDLLILEASTNTLKVVETVKSPGPRMAHVAVLVGSDMVVIGGRRDPSTCLGDVCVLDLTTDTWNYPATTGSYFLPRHRHTAAVVGTNVYVFGGIGTDSILGDLCMLNTCSWEWSLINCNGDIPCPRHSHSLTSIGQYLYLFGGRGAKTSYGDLHIFCLNTQTWTEAKQLGELSVPRFSHSMTAAGKWLVILGGCPIAKHGLDVFLFDVERLVGMRVPLALAPADVLMVRHTTSLVEKRLIIVGGGAACFAFGAKFNSPFFINLEPLEFDRYNRTLIGRSFINQSTEVTYPDGEYFPNDKETTIPDRETWILKLEKNSAKAGKDALKLLGWLDQARKSKVLNGGTFVAFPITEPAASCLRNAHEGTVFPTGRSLITTRVYDQSFPHDVLVKLLQDGGEVVEMGMAYNTKRPVSPLITLQQEVLKLLESARLPGYLLEELPKKWEQLGDMAVLPAGSLSSSSWSILGSLLLTTIAKALRVRRIGRQAPVAGTGTRDSNLQVLWGEETWVEHRENGILYCFDATKCMFSSGNVSEKLRMAALDCANETVVDLFAGIGYYVLPFLQKAQASKVYACEWNPNAIVALRHNLRVNAVEDRCVVVEGDNQVTAPKGVADRVCLGLLPSSEGSWKVAVTALRPEGGVMHVHENVKDTEQAQWLDYLVASVRSIAATLGRHWEVHVSHLERVKWYAPHIRHLVADVQCKAIGSAGTGDRNQ